MKLNKGYTLSQFVDFVTYEVGDSLGPKMMAVIEYNNFLKQPLTKDMFIVSEVITTLMDRSKTVNEIIEEAEKKVIFDGWEYFDSYAICVNRINVEFKNSIFPYGGGLGVMELKGKALHTHFKLETIGDLFNAIPNITIKNVEI